ncbi:MAG TPA: hypothetical protein VEP28_00235 [Rubrobacter sp.]|nr:hypothetical protein [Rubrobacter sp.]
MHVNQIFSFPSGDPAEFEGLSQEELQYLQVLQGFVERAVHERYRRPNRRPSPMRWPTRPQVSSLGAASFSGTHSAPMRS